MKSQLLCLKGLSDDDKVADWPTREGQSRFRDQHGEPVPPRTFLGFCSAAADDGPMLKPLAQDKGLSVIRLSG